jgi:hypothetical protein
MNRAKRNWMAEAISLFLAISLSALVVASAFASTAQASEWEIEGATLSELELKEEKISGSGGPITLSVPSLGIQVKCLKATATGTIFSGGTDQLSTSLAECATEMKEKVIPACKVTEPVVAKTKSQPINVKGSFFDKFEAEGKGAIATLFFPEICALAETSNLLGSFAAKVPLGEQVERQLELTAGAETALKFGANAASLAGSLSLKLSGAKAGKEW